MKIGDKVYLNENARVTLGLPDGVEYQIKDILTEEHLLFPIVITAEEFGKDWEQFTRESELIPIEE